MLVLRNQIVELIREIRNCRQGVLHDLGLGATGAQLDPFKSGHRIFVLELATNITDRLGELAVTETDVELLHIIIEYFETMRNISVYARISNASLHFLEKPAVEVMSHRSNGSQMREHVHGFSAFTAATSMTSKSRS